MDSVDPDSLTTFFRTGSARTSPPRAAIPGTLDRQLPAGPWIKLEGFGKAGG